MKKLLISLLFVLFSFNANAICTDDVEGFGGLVSSCESDSESTKTSNGYEIITDTKTGVKTAHKIGGTRDESFTFTDKEYFINKDRALVPVVNNEITVVNNTGKSKSKLDNTIDDITDLLKKGDIKAEYQVSDRTSLTFKSLKGEQFYIGFKIELR